MKNLLLLFGGQSSEHTVSCNSAASLIPFVDRELFDLVLVGRTRITALRFSRQAVLCKGCR